MKPFNYVTVFLVILVTVYVLQTRSLTISSHPVVEATLGTPSTEQALAESIHKPGILVLEKVHVGTLQSTRGEQYVVPAAEANQPENVEVYFYAIHHPENGLYLIDAGLPRTYKELIGSIISSMFFDEDSALIHGFTETWLKDKPKLAGVFLTHLHFDHMLGVAALPQDTPIFVGPGDGKQQDLLSIIAGSPADAALEGRPPLRELELQVDMEGGRNSVLDVFSDGSLWAIPTPSHSPGSTAFLANTTNGPQLITGDAVRLNGEWLDGLIPAYALEEEVPAVIRDRKMLKALVSQNPQITVHLGHQELKGQPATEQTEQ